MLRKPIEVNTATSFLQKHTTVSLFVVVLTALAATGLWVQFDVSQKQLRASLIEQAGQRSVQLSDALSEQFSLLMRNVGVIVHSLQHAWLTDRDNFDASIEHQVSGFPDGAIEYVAIVDADGSLLYANQGFSAREALANREYLKARAGEMRDSLHIGNPAYSSTSKRWSIPLYQAMHHGDASSEFIQIGLSPVFLSDLLARVDISEHDIIVYLDRYGRFLAQNKELDKAIGRSVKESRPFLGSDAPVNGVLQAAATLDGIPRIFGWTVLPDSGVITVVGLDQNALLAPFNRQNAQAYWRSVYIILMIVALGGVVSLLLMRLSRQQQSLQDHRRFLNEAQRIAHIGNWELDHGTGRLWWSDEIYRIFGVSPDEFGGTYEAFLESVHPEDRDLVDTQYRSSIETHSPYSIEHRIVRRDDGTERWVHERCEQVLDDRGEIIRSSGTVQDITERKHMDDELKKLVETDSLTGLLTRRHFLEHLERDFARFVRGLASTVAVIMIDLDYFKRINDTYGHATGDTALRHVAQLMQDEMRSIDIIGRLGGEEFGLILPGTDAVAARAYSERLRQGIADSPLIIKGESIGLTISIGIGEFDTGDTESRQALERADKALYRAKKNGRNRTEVFATEG